MLISLALAVLDSWLLIRMNTFKANTFCHNNTCVVTKFANKVGKNESPYYNTSFACVIMVGIEMTTYQLTVRDLKPFYSFSV